LRSLISKDEKAKAKIGVSTIFKYIHSNKYYEISAGPKVFDHDFPIGNGYLIVPSGIDFEDIK